MGNKEFSEAHRCDFGTRPPRSNYSGSSRPWLSIVVAHEALRTDAQALPILRESELQIKSPGMSIWESSLQGIPTGKGGREAWAQAEKNSA